MLSNNAVKLLKWLEKNDRWLSQNQIESGCKSFENRAFRSLTSHKMVDSRLSEDSYDWAKYRINDHGKAYLDEVRSQRLPEFREWINTLLPLLSFIGGLLLSDPVKDFFRWVSSLLD